MKEYAFEKIGLKGIPGFYQKVDDYHEVIHRYAMEGWELLQIFSPPTSLYGSAAFIELIFTRTRVGEM
ncbi:DUF4177 domain-containing protein [Metasolibacillus meyeri]|uniref:DUF4177 domain-containing protein n=1 Tax=Metasolibacillus meyeri TaxID=1071052 RepID=A0AAW9NW63_9BACL|nr:DUF4177 domain-containing protein [Metasolibacillus meyeri]MEC1180837.1 DUF4177 domain-containing protein [Metasolibacillus meyeri]